MWLEPATTVMGDPVEMFAVAVVDDALAWVGLTVVISCVLAAL